MSLAKWRRDALLSGLIIRKTVTLEKVFKITPLLFKCFWVIYVLISTRIIWIRLSLVMTQNESSNLIPRLVEFCYAWLGYASRTLLLFEYYFNFVFVSFLWQVAILSIQIRTTHPQQNNSHDLVLCYSRNEWHWCRKLFSFQDTPPPKGSSCTEICILKMATILKPRNASLSLCSNGVQHHRLFLCLWKTAPRIAMQTTSKSRKPEKIASTVQVVDRTHT